MGGLVGSPYDVDTRFVSNVFDVQFVDGTSADQTVPEVDDFRAFVLQPFSFGKDFVGFTPVTAATGIKAHEFDGVVPLKLPGLVPHGRETVESSAVRTVGIAPDDADFRRHGCTSFRA
jgi:hypothetical protein